jgi:hypothetical protein
MKKAIIAFAGRSARHKCASQKAFSLQSASLSYKCILKSKHPDVKSRHLGSGEWEFRSKL